MNFFYNYRYALTIIIIIIVYAIIYAYILGINFNDYIDTNWHKMKQNPFIAPFGGLIGKGRGKNIITKTLYNIYSYFHTIFKKIISIFTKPFIYFFIFCFPICNIFCSILSVLNPHLNLLLQNHYF